MIAPNPIRRPRLRLCGRRGILFWPCEVTRERRRLCLVGVPSVTASFATHADFRPERDRLLAGVTAATASLATSAVGNDPHPRSSVVIQRATTDSLAERDRDSNPRSPAIGTM